MLTMRLSLFLLLVLQIGCASHQGVAPAGDDGIWLPDGSRYQGPLKDGLMHGQGTLSYADGGVYEGGFRLGRLHGHGTFTDANGDVLAGEFAEGETVGQGTISFADGGRYTGEWRNWLAHGDGTWVTASGDEYRGRFEYGEYSGQGTLVTVAGETYTGGFSGGRYHGTGTLTWTDAQGAEQSLSGPWSRGYYVGSDRQHHVSSGHSLPDGEAVLYRQAAMMEQALGGLAASNPGRPDLYVLTFAADGNQDVFRKEALFARQMLDNVYGVRGRTLSLINSPRTVDHTPLATGTNLGIALDGLARVMDVEEDILLVFLTSHGSADHELSVDLPGVPLNDLAARRLREQLDGSGIRWRVVVVSACYSGGFIAPLRDERTMVITSARSDRTSFGCSDDADLTYFGRAFFEQALPGAASLEDAFFDARQRIHVRELQEGMTPSEPQFHTTGRIDAKLREIRRTTLAGRPPAQSRRDDE